MNSRGERKRKTGVPFDFFFLSSLLSEEKLSEIMYSSTVETRPLNASKNSDFDSRKNPRVFEEIRSLRKRSPGDEIRR